jgi:hypothetical protein
VDVAPVQAQRFAAAQPGGQHQPEQRFQSVDQPEQAQQQSPPTWAASADGW